MANKSGKAYALTTLCPISIGNIIDKDGIERESYDKAVRRLLQDIPLNEKSFFAQVDNTYFARLFILNDVFFQQGDEFEQDHLKSKYLCFNTNFHGDLEPYLINMWDKCEDEIRTVWQYCVGFKLVNSALEFVHYIKECQLKTTLFFNGSNDESLTKQLKALYVKQMFSEFVLTQQGKSASETKVNFKYFLQRVQLNNLESPSWKPGQSELTP
ncbi:MAG TPA: hypothetical protein DIC30_02405 [Oceanospirillales bacterium]|nr:hypothetical protein [Oceanospirillales bacterium]|tara:strand:+ start:1495 stop:2133 length:639 start_codon:yes stop_codon:yes gene_type:complete